MKIFKGCSDDLSAVDYKKFAFEIGISPTHVSPRVGYRENTPYRANKTVLRNGTVQSTNNNHWVKPRYVTFKS